MKKQLKPEEMHPVDFTVRLASHIVRDLKDMEKNSQQSIDEIVSKALLMFIATHSDFLGRTK